MLLIVMLISLAPAQAFAADTVAVDSTVISDVAETAAEEMNFSEYEPVPEGEVEIIPMPEEEYEEVIEEPEPTVDENGENDSADGEGETSEQAEKTSVNGEDAEKDADVEETEEDAEPDEDEDKLFPGMPEGYILSAEQIAGKQALNAYGVVDTLCEAVAGVDYADGEVFFLADTLEYAQTVAAAYGAELTEYASGVATIKLNGATVLDAVTAAADMNNNMPIVEANYTYKIEPVIETDSGNVSTYAYCDETGLAVKGSWKTWFESTDSPDTYMSSPGNWDYQYMHDVVNTYEAWGVTKGAGVTVAVMDSGVGYNDDLNGNVIIRECAGSWSEYISDHGTHVAGIIAAKMGNGEGGAGIAPEAKIYSERVMNDDCEGHTEDIVRGINNVINAKKGGLSSIKVMNMSLGSYGYSALEATAIQNAINSNITVVVAMGNEGTNIQCYPAACNIPGLIAVQSSNKANTLSYFSNYGAWADVTAPGSDIMSTMSKNGYDMMSGTSMATPVVSGLCALYLSVYPDATPVQVEAAIKKATTNGIVDASKLFNAENKTPTITPQAGKNKDGSLPYGSYIEIAAADSAETIIFTVGSQTPSIKNGIVTGTVVDVSDGEAFVLPITSEKGFTVGKNVSVKAAAVNGFGMMSKVKTVNVKVGYANPTGVEIINPPEKLISGKSYTLSAKVYPDEANQKVTWDIVKGNDCKGTSLGTKTGALKTGKNDNGTITVLAYSADDTAKSVEVQIQIAPLDPTKKISILFNGNVEKTLNCTINSSNIGQSAQLTAVSYKANNPSEPVYDDEYTWKSSNPKVATVDEDGTIAAVGMGSATITCTAKDGSNVKATLPVKVLTCADEMSISGLSVVAPGKTAQYKANLELSKDSPLKTINYKTVTWSVENNPYGIKIDQRGKVTVPAGVPGGTQFTILARNTAMCYAGKTITVSKEIANIKIVIDDDLFGGLRTYANDGSVKQVTLFTTAALDGYYDNEGNYNFGKGGYHFSEIQLGLEEYPSCELEITSSNEKVAYFDDESGYVKAVSPGAAKITCKATDAGRKSASVNIVVVNPASSVTVVTKEASLRARNWMPTLSSGKSVRNTVTLGDAYGTPTIKKVTWDFAITAVEFDAKTENCIGVDTDRKYTDYAKANKLISINKNTGQLTASKSALSRLRNEFDNDTYIYNFNISAIAYSTDGSPLCGSETYDLSRGPISKLCVEYNGQLYTNLKLPKSLTANDSDSGAIIRICREDSSDFNDCTVKSSNPNVAAAIIPYNGTSQSYFPYVQIIPGQKAGSATITVTAADGSNKKATIKVTVK